MKWLLPIILLPWLSASAATIPAASASLSDVQTAVTSASTGDLVTIPSGTATWATNLVVLDKGITISGAGQGTTIITDGTGVNPPGIDGLFYFRSPTNVWSGLSNLTVIGGSSYSAVSISLRTSAPAYVNTLGTPAFFRFSHLTLTNISTRGVNLVNDMQGLIDHSIFICPVSGTGISPDGTDIFSSNRWATAWSPGTTNMIVVEDCFFDWKTTIANGSVDAYSGQVFAFRHCIGTNVDFGWHGTDSGGINRSVLGGEFYQITNYYNIGGFPYSIRGGSGVIWSNRTVILAGGTDTSDKIILNQYRNTGTNVYGPPTACCNPFGGVSITNKWDGDTDQYGYPGLDQLGRTGPTTYGATNTVQALVPCYFWGNVYNGTNCDLALVGNDVDNLGSFSYIARPGLMVQINRDWFEGTPKPGYTPLSYPHPLIAPATVIPASTVNGGTPSRRFFQ